ncbi:alpha/beta hydrolase-fold protein [Reichenbachiella carrageenanivorans]|uniref:Alpha/beta hydrolase-fold protein n=1 Tax=Reichenbachiella carrageenanivorans TaxID=2979869 RepID=A0ABY6D206_9BACT|nr:alpha/beta hydrolase-fold protein [Reichenbachiella carrageenanivorans]UXX77870.1 alpha/beta hydrolase-fold protein [Reichenbachiella carrageenanivorans]
MADSKFKTTELSDPQFGMDGLRFITVKTPNLKGRGDLCVFVPKGENLKDLPIVTLLHGVYGSAWIWTMKGGAHQTTQRLIDEQKIKPMILAMPSDGLWGDGSGYLPHSGLDFEKWIAEDVPAAVIENIPEASADSPRFIGGLSMGGYGALRIGAKYANRYRGISGHSSITELNQMALFVEEPLSAYFQTEERDESVFFTLKDNQASLPPLRFDCGADDLLIEHNRELSALLTQHNIKHIYEEFEGGHQWEYWQTHLVDTLLFFDKTTR